MDGRSISCVPPFSLPLNPFNASSLTPSNSPRPNGLRHRLPQTRQTRHRNAGDGPQNRRKGIPRRHRGLPSAALPQSAAHGHVSRVLHEAMVERHKRQARACARTSWYVPTLLFLCTRWLYLRFAATARRQPSWGLATSVRVRVRAS